METRLTEKESLELISQMINSAKDNLQKGTGKIFLLWGYLTLFISMLNLVLYVLIPESGNYYSFLVWCLMPAGVLLHYYLAGNMPAGTRVKTYIDQVMGYVWLGFSISVFTWVIGNVTGSLVAPHVTGRMFDFLWWFNWEFMIPVMLVLYGFALFVSGKAYRFKPLVSGGIICWIMTLVIFIFLGNDYVMEIQLVALMVCLVAGYIIPGHLLNRKENGHVPGA